MEHEVSLRSASNIYNAIDREKYDALLIGVDKSGRWRFREDPFPAPVDLSHDDFFVGAIDVTPRSREGRGELCTEGGASVRARFDLIFPIIHGHYGEDGTLQGYLQALGLPFVGPDLLGSAIGMDKDVAKRLLKEAGMPVANWRTLYSFQSEMPSFEELSGLWGLPLFVKPANAGSSVGVSKVTDAEGYRSAIREAFRYDRKVLVEEAVIGKEVECAVLGNESPAASVLGEIVPKAAFYSYEAKYLDDDGASLRIPADIDPVLAEELRLVALRAFGVLCCEGMARVDFFVRPDGGYVVNEINTLPGFTSISMYPKLWEATGLGYGALIGRLVRLALDRAQREAALVRAR